MDEGTQDDQGRDGQTNFILRIKEQETRLTLHEHDDDDILGKPEVTTTLLIPVLGLLILIGLQALIKILKSSSLR